MGVLDLTREDVHDHEDRHRLCVEADRGVDPQAVERDAVELTSPVVDGPHPAAQPERGAVGGVEPVPCVVAVALEVEGVDGIAPGAELGHGHLLAGVCG
jgi:hypothetical protein